MNIRMQTTTTNLTSHMSTLTKRIIVLLFVTALLTIAAMGCNTARGFGKDVSSTGDAIQRGTD